VASFETINRLLTVAAKLLDVVAAEIRDARFEPVRENIEQIGRALVEIFDVQHKIYALRPDLTPEYLNEPSQYPEANRLLTEYMFRASELERAGNVEGAIAEFERFLQLNSSPLHKEIVHGEIERLRNSARP
jgi:hypothetical protein